MDKTFSPIKWEDHHLKLLDQTKLPAEEVWLDCTTPQHVADAILCLAVRGAPSIGVAAAYGVILGVQGVDESELEQAFHSTADFLEGTRPTAVNLRWAIEQGRRVFEVTKDQGTQAVCDALLELAHRLKAQEIESCQQMGQFGSELFDDGNRVLTHCNAGALATVGYGTALGVIRAAWENGKKVEVWVDETRPLLQGARLNSWELKQLGIPFHVIPDNSAGAIMSRGWVDRIVVGADRIAANGDAANKIGTYSVAVLAQRHNVPFYVAAPLSTIDLDTPTGADIPIEERDPNEVTNILGKQQITPSETPAMNLAFDVTPNELIAAIITEMGVLNPPYTESIRDAFERAKAS